MFWVLVRCSFLLISLVTVTWAVEIFFGFWPSVGVALFSIVIGIDRVEKYFQDLEDSENWRGM